MRNESGQDERQEGSEALLAGGAATDLQNKVRERGGGKGVSWEEEGAGQGEVRRMEEGGWGVEGGVGEFWVVVFVEM